MKKVINLFLFLAISYSIQAQTTWTVDPSHSELGFSVSHLTISEINGNFKAFEGTLQSSKEDFSDAKISFTGEVNSINTENDARDKHLTTEDFFYAEKHPKITFVSTSFKKKTKEKYQLKGNLTLRGVTKSVTFDVNYGGIITDAYGNTRAGFSATTTLNRIDYGVAWNAKTEHGGWTVGETVALLLKLEFIKSK